MLVYFSHTEAAPPLRADVTFWRGVSTTLSSSCGAAVRRPLAPAYAMMPTRNTATLTRILNFQVSKKSFKGSVLPFGANLRVHKKSADSRAIRARVLFAAENSAGATSIAFPQEIRQPASGPLITYDRRRCPARRAAHPHDPALHRHPWPHSPAGPRQHARQCRSRSGSADPDRAAGRRRRSG